MRRAFTLIEVLMAVFTLSIMAMLLYGTVTTLFTAQRDLDDVVEVNHMARVSLDRMVRDLSQAFLSMNLGLQDTRKTLFIGERDRVVFCYVGNVPVKAGEVETDQGVVEYRLGGTPDKQGGRKLIRRFKSVIDDDPEDGGVEAVMATGVKALRFEYYDREGDDWESDWKADDPADADEPGFTLPPRIRIRLEMVDVVGESHVFETQTTVYITKPIQFGISTHPEVLAWKLLQQQKKLEDAGEAIRDGAVR